MGYETFYTGWSSPNMRLFNKLLRELFVSHTILYFSCKRQRTNFQDINSAVINSKGNMFWIEPNKSFTPAEHHAVTIAREGFTISLRFLCVIRSPLRFSTARTNITDTFLSIVVTKVEEFWLKNASSKGFPKAEPWAPASSYVPFDQRSVNKQYAQYWRMACRIKGAGD